MTASKSSPATVLSTLEALNAACASLSPLKRRVAGVCAFGVSLRGSIGGFPPFGEASVSSTSASLKT
jgi:hypothetical protein